MPGTSISTPCWSGVDLASAAVGADRVEVVLLGLAQVASQVVNGAENASLTLVGAGGTLSTPEFTGALAKQMDALQYETAQGPCVEAATATQWTAILVTDLRMDQLKTAMATQTVIGQAQGILMERHKLTAGQAFGRLRTASMNLNRKLRDVARDLSETGEEKALTPRRALAGQEPGRMGAVAGLHEHPF